MPKTRILDGNADNIQGLMAQLQDVLAGSSCNIVECLTALAGMWALGARDVIDAASADEAMRAQNKKTLKRMADVMWADACREKLENFELENAEAMEFKRRVARGLPPEGNVH